MNAQTVKGKEKPIMVYVYGVGGWESDSEVYKIFTFVSFFFE